MSDHYILNADKFTFHVRFSILKEDLNDIFEILVQFVKRKDES